MTSGLIHTGLGSSSIIAHVVHSPPPPPANSFVIGPAVINTHTIRSCSNKHTQSDQINALHTQVSDERTPIEATPLSATAELRLASGLGLGLGLGLDSSSLSHSSSHTLPFFSPPSFHTLSLSPAFTIQNTVCHGGGQPSPHKPRLVVSHSTCPPLSSSPHAHSFVLGTEVINTHTPGSSRVPEPSPAMGGLQIPQWLGSDPLWAWWLGLAPATLEFWALIRFPNERNQGAIIAIPYTG